MGINFTTMRDAFIALLGVVLIFMAIKLGMSKDSGNLAKTANHGLTAVVVVLIGGIGAAMTAGSLVGWNKVLSTFGIA